MERDQDIFKELVIIMASHSRGFYNASQIQKAAGERARDQDIYTHHLDLLCDLELTKEAKRVPKHSTGQQTYVQWRGLTCATASVSGHSRAPVPFRN
jgi:hypothetical protein